MENLTIDPKTVSDPIALRGEMREALATIAGKWKLEILWLLNQRIHRFGELKRAIPGITQHMLTAQLRELEADGLVSPVRFSPKSRPAWSMQSRRAPRHSSPLSTRSSHGGASMEAPHRRTAAFDGLRTVCPFMSARF
jgi:DNA-binding HxlR family transcriptional regulator